jgi:cyclohexyl-isocyanide hydratase
MMNEFTSGMPLSVGMLLFESVTQLDLTGPYEILARIPNTKVWLIAEDMTPVRTEWGMTITPQASFDDAPPVDVLVVPGGWGVDAQLENASLLAFIEQRGTHARYVTSVCSGALLLGAAGLLKGYRATTHWLSLDLLARFGADPVKARVVRDRNRITGAGVTAGIDFALVLAAELHGIEAAQKIQLAIEYQPDPPFESGSPQSAPDAVRRSIVAASEDKLAGRRAVVDRITHTWEQYSSRAVHPHG